MGESQAEEGLVQAVCKGTKGAKKPAINEAGFSGILVTRSKTSQLFDLGFLVHDVLAHDRVKLLDFHLTGHVFLVFVGRVKVTGISR